MNKKMIQIKGFVAAAALASFALVACDSDVLSGPDYNSGNGGNSSAVEQPGPQSSSSEKAESSSSEKVESSSSETQVVNSSSSVEVCTNITTTKCMTACDVAVSSEMKDCETGAVYVCKDGLWKAKFAKDNEAVSKCFVGLSSSSLTVVSSSSIEQKPSSSSAVEVCPNGHWTTHCNGIWAQEPVCCEEKLKETCRHITDYDGMTEKGNCVDQNGLTAVDCVTGANYECQNNNWQPVVCLNVKPDECKPGMGGCGYRLCQPNGIQEIADCGSGAIYVCNGETWEVKQTVDNKRCAQGELEYCDACFKEGVFNGHYKCEGGKWKKYGMGDEICEHITDVKCDDNRPGCGFCGVDNDRLAIDCETGKEFKCDRGYWSLNVKDCENEDGCAIPVCNALAPECGYSEYELCNKYGIDRYCNDKWLSEPCDGSESSRDLRIYAKDDLYRSENYICVNGKWVERYRFYECAEELECDNPSIRCQSSPHIGTACDGDGTTKEVDGCVLLCSNGAYRYAPPPM